MPVVASHREASLPPVWPLQPRAKIRAVEWADATGDLVGRRCYDLMPVPLGPRASVGILSSPVWPA
jgi:hypothetical protein